MKCLIDGDVIVYQAGFASDTNEYKITHPADPSLYYKAKYKRDVVNFCTVQEIDPALIEKEVTYEPLEHCLHSVKMMLESIIEATEADGYEVILSGAGNFRQDIFPDYKKNRDPKHKPHWYKEIKEYLIEHHNAFVTSGEEADDMLGILQCSAEEETCICTIDKDLDMIPGWHYNWNKEDFYMVDTENADRNFFKQWLQGDATDNIPGLKGIGPKKAENILKDIKDNMGMMAQVYHNFGQAEWAVPEAELTASLIWIRRSDGSTWKDLMETMTEDIE